MILFWILFNVFVVAMLVLDLGVFHRKSHTVKFREALLWSVVWIALAARLRGGGFLLARPREALEFVTGYVIELSLSVDNLFIFLLIFRFFKVSAPHQHKVLFWGILGALGDARVFYCAGRGADPEVSLDCLHFRRPADLQRHQFSSRRKRRSIRKKIRSSSLFRKLVPVTEDYQGDSSS